MVKGKANGAGSMGFDSWAGKIGRSVVNAGTLLGHYIARTQNRKDKPATYHTLVGNAASIMRTLFEKS